MTIVRNINGQEIKIELTDSEMREAFEQKRSEYYYEDVCSNYADVATEEQLCEIADMFERNLDHCDPYYDAYWDCMGYTASEILGG